MVCKMDPRRPQFCVERQIIGAAAAKLKGKGLGKKGLGAKVRQKVLKKVPSGMRQEKRAREENDEGKAVAVSPLLLPPPKKKRRSADRDLFTETPQSSTKVLRSAAQANRYTPSLPPSQVHLKSLSNDHKSKAIPFEGRSIIKLEEGTLEDINFS